MLGLWGQECFFGLMVNFNFLMVCAFVYRQKLVVFGLSYRAFGY